MGAASSCSEWMWKSDDNPWSDSEPAQWSYYSDLESLIIEEAYSNRQPQTMLDKYYIDFTKGVQISRTNPDNQRPIKRVNTRSQRIREHRFMDAPIISKRSMGGEYGWVSPFIIEVRRHLGLKRGQLPSQDPSLIPMLVEKAALGIIEEGILLDRYCEASILADLLRRKKNKGIKEVWKWCAYLYSLESFLYKKLNESMRLIGDKEHEEIWRSKIPTLGPFCLLLWDDPINTKVKTEMKLYRGANLNSEQLAVYEDMMKHPNEYRSFQAFTSCSRNRQKAEKFGDTLFIMDVQFAFMADISSLSEYKSEEEELLGPGVCFCVQNVKFDHQIKKRVIMLRVLQRWSGRYKRILIPCYAEECFLYFEAKSFQFDIRLDYMTE